MQDENGAVGSNTFGALAGYYLCALLATILLSLIVGGIAFQLSESLLNIDDGTIVIVRSLGDNQVKFFDMLIGFFGITLVGLCVVFPLGVGGSIFIELLAKRNWARKMMQFGIDTLTRLPALFIGIFGFYLIQRMSMAWDLFSKSFIVGLMLLPTVMNTAGIALQGARKSESTAASWIEVKKRVLDRARSGIFYGIGIALVRVWSELIISIYVATITLALIDGDRLVQLRDGTMGDLFYRLGIEATDTGSVIGKVVILLVLIAVINAVINWILKKFALCEFGKYRRGGTGETNGS